MVDKFNIRLVQRVLLKITVWREVRSGELQKIAGREGEDFEKVSSEVVISVVLRRRVGVSSRTIDKHERMTRGDT